MENKVIPSFWVSEEYSKCTLAEFVEFAIVNRDTKRFNPTIHRNQGWKGSGSCKIENCVCCKVMKKYGV